MDEAEKSVPDQVVLLVDPQSSTPKQSSEIIPQLISGDHNHCSESELKDEHSKEESKPQDEHNKEDSESEDEEEDHNKKCNIKLVVIITKWAAFIVITASLISTFTIPSLIHKTFWGLELWKWCLTILVVFCGRIVSGWLVRFSAFIIQRSFMLHDKVVHLDRDLRMGVQNSVWLGLVLLIWKLMFTPDAQVPSISHRLLNKVARALIVVLVGSIIWVVKIVVMKIVTAFFHSSRFFHRIKNSIAHEYILYTLSIPSSLRKMNRSRWRKRIGIDPKELMKLRRKSLSWWGVSRLVRHVKSTRLSTISKNDKEREILSERRAKAAGTKIFKNIIKAGARYIKKDDLLSFLKEGEVDIIFPLLEARSKMGKIKQSAVESMVMMVEEMEVLTTTFLRSDGQRIFYPNVLLLTKPISNFSRSSDIGDIIEFSVDVSTSSEIFSAMKERIKHYIKKNPTHWQPRHSVVVKSIEDLTKMKIAVYVFYTMNFLKSWEGNDRRSDLIIALMKIFDELGMINYNLPAQRIILPQSTTAPHGDPMTQG